VTWVRLVLGALILLATLSAIHHNQATDLAVG